jgi:hypothetical protein
VCEEHGELAVEREMPPLPEPYLKAFGLMSALFTGNQLKEYARAAVEQAMAQQVPVAEVDEGDDGLFVAILYGENGSPLKRGDKLYLSAAAPLRQALDCYDAGYINDFGGGDVAWWRDYLLAELGRAYDHYQTQVDSWNENAAPLAQPAVPPDYVIVPKEPTEDMAAAWISANATAWDKPWIATWKAMIAAAPAQKE